jgi:hypothetical protein
VRKQGEGESAFPTGHPMGEYGMTLRDYFAAHAPPVDEEWLNKYARDVGIRWTGLVDAKTAWAFYWADAMIEARKVKT